MVQSLGNLMLVVRIETFMCQAKKEIGVLNFFPFKSWKPFEEYNFKECHDEMVSMSKLQKMIMVDHCPLLVVMQVGCNSTKVAKVRPIMLLFSILMSLN